MKRSISVCNDITFPNTYNTETCVTEHRRSYSDRKHARRWSGITKPVLKASRRKRQDLYLLYRLYFWSKNAAQIPCRWSDDIQYMSYSHRTAMRNLRERGKKKKNIYLDFMRPCSAPQAISLTAFAISCLEVYAKQTFKKHLAGEIRNRYIFFKFKMKHN